MTGVEYNAAVRLRLARKFVTSGGWLTAGFVDMAEHAVARDAMLGDGHIVRRDRDGIRAYEITDAGLAWLAEQES